MATISFVRGRALQALDAPGGSRSVELSALERELSTTGSQFSHRCYKTAHWQGLGTVRTEQKWSVRKNAVGPCSVEGKRVLCWCQSLSQPGAAHCSAWSLPGPVVAPPLNSSGPSFISRIVVGFMDSCHLSCLLSSWKAGIFFVSSTMLCTVGNQSNSLNQCSS